MPELHKKKTVMILLISLVLPMGIKARQLKHMVRYITLQLVTVLLHDSELTIKRMIITLEDEN